MAARAAMLPTIVQRAASRWGVAFMAACSVGCADRPADDLGSPPGQRLTAARSFTVHGALMPAPLPGQQDFMLRVDPVARTMLAGGRAEAFRSALSGDGGSGFRTTGSVTFALPQAGCGSSVTYTSFHFVAGTEGVRGVAAGTASVFDGDMGTQSPAQLEFTGDPDTTGPSLATVGDGQDPLAPLFVAASEPLPAAPAAQLVAGDDVLTLSPVVANAREVVIAFEKAEAARRALRYGSTYSITVDPWVDLAGNAGGAFGAFTTGAAPLPIAEDGFEGGAAAGVRGAADPVVIDASLLPPISGDWSAVVGPVVASLSPPVEGGAGRLTVRLTVQPGDSVVRFSMRAIASSSSVAATGAAVARLAVPGGAIADVALPPAGSLDSEQSLPGGATVRLGAVQAVEAALPAAASGEVIFDFDTGAAAGRCTPPSAVVSYLLDDVRVE